MTKLELYPEKIFFIFLSNNEYKILGFDIFLSPEIFPKNINMLLGAFFS
jgi:hypothetical protein